MINRDISPPYRHGKYGDSSICIAIAWTLVWAVVTVLAFVELS